MFDTNTITGAYATNTSVDIHAMPSPTATASQRLSSTENHTFSSNYYRQVDRTTHIADRLPNAVFTLPVHLVQAIVGGAELSTATRQALVAECKKFYLANKEYEENKEVFVDGETYCESTTVTLDCGRLYADGYNDDGQCGIGSDECYPLGPRLIRLPPVLQVWCGYNSWFANTTRGLYAWGLNRYSDKLGTGQRVLHTLIPTRVAIRDPPLGVVACQEHTFLRTARGWYGAGNNEGNYSLALGHQDPITTFSFIPGSERVTLFSNAGFSTMAWTPDALLGAGGRLLPVTGDRTILSPVALPNGVTVADIDRFIIGDVIFLVASPRCWVIGENTHGLLGLGDNLRRYQPSWTELPFPVEMLAVAAHRRGSSAVALSDGQLVGWGLNRDESLSDNPHGIIFTPFPLRLPGPVVKLAISVCIGNLAVQLPDGTWVGRGSTRGGWFPRPDVPSSGGVAWTELTHEASAYLDAEPKNVKMLTPPTPVTAPEYAPITRRLADMEALETVEGEGCTMVRTAAGWGLVCGDTLIPIDTAGRRVTRWVGCRGTAFAWTDEGLMAAGYNWESKTGTGIQSMFIPGLTRVAVDDEILEVQSFPCQTFFRTAGGWLSCGANITGSLGVGHHHTAQFPEPVPHSASVTRWASVGDAFFAWADQGLMMCGNYFSSGTDCVTINYDVDALTPVALPDDVKGRVDRVVGKNTSSFIFSGRRCFAVGRNSHGQLGVGSDEKHIHAPIELPFPVDDVVAGHNCTVFRTGADLHWCGTSFIRDTPNIRSPQLIAIGQPVVKVVVHIGLSLKTRDGDWIGRWYGSANNNKNDDEDIEGKM